MKNRILLLETVNLRHFLLTVLVLLTFESISQTYTLKGLVYQNTTKTNLIGANILLLETNQGTFSDKDGRFSFLVSPGSYTIRISYIGYSSYEQKIVISKDQNITINLEPIEEEISEITITNSRSKQSIDNPQTGMVKLSMLDIKRIPAFLGESDPLKAIRLTPGVQAGGEGNAGIFVRGGDAGQNLILLEDMPIYNPSHLLGLYSVFNPAIIKSVTLYKGSYPSGYGGKASSLMKIGIIDAIPQKPEVEGSVGLISSRIAVRVPLFKGKASLMLGGRYTYLQVLQPIFNAFQIKNDYLKNNAYNFNDLNGRFEAQLSPKNKIIINSYSGVDHYEYLHSSSGITNKMNWGNRAATLKWIHFFSSECSWSNTFGFTTYFFNLNATYKQYGLKLKSKVSDPFFRSEVMYSFSKHFVQVGIELTKHSLIPESANVNINENRYRSELRFSSGEASIFFNDTYDLNSKISIITGIRGTIYAHLGPYDRFSTDAQGVVIDSSHYGQNEIVKKYYGIEPRVSAIYKQSESGSFKASLSRNYQFIHLISVGTVSLPTDIWFPSTFNVKPEYTDQISLGYFKNFQKNKYETSFELYFKRLNNVIEFKNSLMTNYKNNEFEKSITRGIGYSFGAEWLFRKSLGDFTGWLSYTLAWSIRKFNDINNGDFFYGKYDRRHDLALTLQYQVSKHWSLSSLFIYSTGNAMTLPAGRYMIQGSIVNDYTSVNSFRMPAYHRLDISATHARKVDNKYESIWNFSIYNLYNRSNPYYVFFEAKGNLDEYYLSVKAKKVSLFPILPSVSWTFKF